jgi:hypothetical protein
MGFRKYEKAKKRKAKKYEEQNPHKRRGGRSLGL